MAKKSIDKLVQLTPGQKKLCKRMEELYIEMQQADIAFACNDNGYVVAYNTEDIEDCEGHFFGKVPDGFEELDQNDMRMLFPVWLNDSLCVKRKKKRL